MEDQEHHVGREDPVGPEDHVGLELDLFITPTL